MTHALIIIDMQLGSFGPDTPRHDADGVVRRLNALAECTRAQDGAVIFVQHDGPPGDPHAPDTPGWQLLPALVRRAADLTVRKTTNDAFHDTDLDELLRARGVSRLVLTGCATDFCVDSTIRAAVSRRFEICVPADGHTTADRPHLTAPEIICHHNYVWGDLFTPTKPVRVAPTAELLAMGLFRA